MRKSESSTGSRLLKVGVATAATAAVVVGAAAPALAATVPMTLSSATGPSATVSTFTGTTATSVFSTAVTPYTTFQYVGTGTAAACAATYVAPVAIAVTGTTQSAGIVAATKTQVLSTRKVAITQPVTLALGGTQASARYNVCVYSGNTVASTGVTGSPLVANASYTIAARATVTSVSPGTGPALGGSQITVVGTNFPAAGLTATIGGRPLTGIVVNSAGTSFTATTPAHPADSGLALVVTTSGGSTTRANSFSYTNGITVSPNTGPNTGSTDVDVLGVGFAGIDFSTTGSSTQTAGTIADTNGHVYLVRDEYDPAADATTATNKANGPVAECTDVLVVSDGEVICTLNLTRSIDVTGAPATSTAVPVGTYTMTVVSDGRLGVTTAANAAFDANFSKSIVSSGSTFTVAPY